MNPDDAWRELQQHIANGFSAFLVYATHFVFVVAIVMAITGVIRTIYRMEHGERVVSCLAVLSAMLAYFLSKALGISIPEIILHAISDTPIGLSLTLVAFIIPGLTGAAVAFLINRAADQSGQVHKRVIIFVTTMLLLVFVDVYSAAIQQTHGHVLNDKQLAPNGSFILGMGLYWVLNPSSGKQFVQTLVKRKSGW